MFFLSYRHTDDGVFTIFRRFRATFRRLPKILQNLFEGRTDVPEHFSKISEDYRRLPKIFEENPRMFRSHTNEFKDNLRDKLGISEIIDISISKDIEITPPEPRMWFRMNFTSGVFSSKTLLSM